MGEATSDPVRLPPGPRVPKALMGVAFLTARHRAVASIGRRHGSAFTVNLPIFGETVVIGDPALIKDLFTTSSDLVGRASNLGTVLGPGSTFSLDGDEHRARRKLLVPPFHGKRMVGYEAIVEEEVMREIASWPEGREFETLQPMMRITLNAILRTVFGAQGSAFDELRELFPPMIPLASRLAVMPAVFRSDLGATTRSSPTSSPRRAPIPASKTATMCSPSCWRRGTRTARRSPTTTSPTNFSRCCQPATRPRRRRWHGRSNGCAGIPGC
jgi:cytochrome P450